MKKILFIVVLLSTLILQVNAQTEKRADLNLDLSYGRNLGYQNPNVGMHSNGYIANSNFSASLQLDTVFRAHKYFGDGHAYRAEVLGGAKLFELKNQGSVWFIGGVYVGRQYTSEFNKTASSVIVGGQYKINNNDSAIFAYEFPDYLSPNNLSAYRIDYEFIREINKHKWYVVVRPRIHILRFNQQPFGVITGTRVGVSIGFGKRNT